jgi:hypothetical protein
VLGDEPLRVPSVRTGRYPSNRPSSPLEVIRKIGGQLSDSQVAVTMNQMCFEPSDGKAWTTVHVRELRERLGIAPSDQAHKPEEPTFMETCIGSVYKLIRERILPATQLIPLSATANSGRRTRHGGREDRRRITSNDFTMSGIRAGDFVDREGVA